VKFLVKHIKKLASLVASNAKTHPTPLSYYSETKKRLKIKILKIARPFLKNNYPSLKE